MGTGIFQVARTYAYDVVGVAPIRELSALVPDLAVSELHLRTVVRRAFDMCISSAILTIDYVVKWYCNVSVRVPRGKRNASGI